MATHDKLPSYFPNGQPTSPPMTPGTRSHSRFPPQTSHTSPIYKRMGLSMLAQSPPLEFIEPIGQGPQFHFTRPQSGDQSSRPSSASGQACATTPQDSEYEDESDEESTKEIERPARRVEKAEFVLEELDSDPGYDSDIEIVRPDHFEDAISDISADKQEQNGIIDQFKGLRCAGGSSDEEERQRIYRRKKKRWSAGIFKRSHSQSVEGDSSYSDNDPLDDVDASARRLRRRVRGPGDRSSLIFEDKGFPNSNNIVEVEEPEDVAHSKGPPSIPSDDGFTLDELPFWVVEDPMDVEFDSS
ncbi:uncharacterized protein BDR25DRAFT_8292 [Lindgomyces ingoldianus]|uniref:Uncharacterized protein n=1 Tax=Lindgomyces ingoldianus TaxID=673940 RepID=A0ACB6RG82_9PLEO|nr:uncharacterized protein BDR25DRAFT_8292 [Lindgomyces ingoldianus]KAF2478127.1 hypothetical protein BDR25DRAFT_8292 [Lindgomyces ingoldianus]